MPDKGTAFVRLEMLGIGVPFEVVVRDGIDSDTLARQNFII